MNLRWFRLYITISLILHLIGLAMLFLIPERTARVGQSSRLTKDNTLVARLVKPDEEKEVRQDKTPLPRRSPERLSKKGAPQVKKETIGEKGEKSKGEVPDGAGPEAKTSEMGGEKKLKEVPDIGPKTPQSPQTTSPSLSLPAPRTPEPPKPLTLPKERLFDREVVEGLAKKDQDEIIDRGITFDTKELRYHSYMLRLKERIEGIWIYPPEAAEKGIYGDLYIRFTIKKDGRLGNIELLRTSGYRSLDEAAIMALKDAEPFWPLPEEWKKNELIITGHFVYSLYGVYLR